MTLRFQEGPIRGGSNKVSQSESRRRTYIPAPMFDCFLVGCSWNGRGYFFFHPPTDGRAFRGAAGGLDFAEYFKGKTRPEAEITMIACHVCTLASRFWPETIHETDQQGIS